MCDVWVKAGTLGFAPAWVRVQSVGTQRVTFAFRAYRSPNAASAVPTHGAHVLCLYANAGEVVFNSAKHSPS